jgi:hypothetical protein
MNSFILQQLQSMICMHINLQSRHIKYPHSLNGHMHTSSSIAHIAFCEGKYEELKNKFRDYISFCTVVLQMK